MQHFLKEEPDDVKEGVTTDKGHFESSEDSTPPTPRKLVVEAKSCVACHDDKHIIVEGASIHQG